MMGMQVFIPEQVAYSKPDLERHMRTGDLTGPMAESGFKGHPQCRSACGMSMSACTWPSGMSMFACLSGGGTPSEALLSSLRKLYVPYVVPGNALP